MLGNQREMAIHTARSPMGSPRNLLGATQDGRDWAMAALDPCAPEAPMSVGLPDTVTAAVVTPNYRGEHTLSWDTTMFTGSGATGMKSWGVQIVQLPVPEIAYMYRLHNETNNTWSTWQVSRTPGFELPTDDTTMTRAQCTLRSKGYQKARVIGSGTTIELDASGLNNQGRIVCGQLEIAAERADHTILTMTSPGNTNAARLGGGDASTEWHYVVPDTKDYVVSACPRAYQGLAKDGCYIISKFDGPLLGYDFTETGDDGIWRIAAVSDVHPRFGAPLDWLSLTVSDDPDAGLTTSDAEFVNDGSSFWKYLPSGVDVPWSEYVSTHIHPFVSAPSRMLTAVTFVSGLAGSDAATGLTPSLRVKRRMFLECLANAGAGVAPFAHPAPLWDLDAINKVVLVMQQYDDAYPASYNDFGDILGTIWNGLKSVGETVGNVWNNVVKPIGNVIETGVGLAGMF